MFIRYNTPMKKIILFMIAILFVPVVLLSVDLEKYAVKNIIHPGDKVKVQSCNLDGWCKVKDKPFYINGSYFVAEYDRFYVMNDDTQDHTHFYEKKLTTDGEITYDISRRVDETLIIFQDDIIVAEFCDSYGWCKVLDKTSYIKLSEFDTIDSNNFKSLKLKENITHAHYYTKQTNTVEKFDTYDMIVSITGEHDLVIVEECDCNDTTQQEFIDNEKLNELLNEDELYSDPNILGEYYFVYMGLGASKYSIKNEAQNTVVYEDSLDQYTTTGEIGFGVVHGVSTFSTLSLNKSLNLKRATVTDLLYSYNYKFTKPIDAKPYIGIVIGMSDLVWNEKPNTTNINSGVKATGFAVGAQVGLDSKFINSTSIYTRLRYIIKDLNTEIGDEKLTHQSELGLSVGFRIHF